MKNFTYETQNGILEKHLCLTNLLCFQDLITEKLDMGDKYLHATWLFFGSKITFITAISKNYEPAESQNISKYGLGHFLVEEHLAVNCMKQVDFGVP